MLGLVANERINDDGAATLFDCLQHLKALDLFECNLSKDMERKLNERGKEEGCRL